MPWRVFGSVLILAFKSLSGLPHPSPSLPSFAPLNSMQWNLKIKDNFTVSCRSVNKNLKQQKERREQFSQGSAVDSLPPTTIQGSVLQRSNAARGIGQGGSDAVAIDMDQLDNRGLISNDMSQMQIVEQQVGDWHCKLLVILVHWALVRMMEAINELIMTSGIENTAISDSETSKSQFCYLLELLDTSSERPLFFDFPSVKWSSN